MNPLRSFHWPPIGWPIYNQRETFQSEVASCSHLWKSNVFLIQFQSQPDFPCRINWSRPSRHFNKARNLAIAITKIVRKNECVMNASKMSNLKKVFKMINKTVIFVQNVVEICGWLQNGKTRVFYWKLFNGLEDCKIRANDSIAFSVLFYSSWHWSGYIEEKHEFVMVLMIFFGAVKRLSFNVSMNRTITGVYLMTYRAEKGRV